MPSSCPDDNSWNALANGLLSPDRRAELEDHLDGCKSCRRLASALGLAMSASTGASEPATFSESLAPGTHVARYIVERQIGRGSMGTVFAAFDPELNRKLALKLVRRSSTETEESSHGFLQEAQALARLSHANVVPIYDVGRFSDQVFLAMELIEGGTLEKFHRDPPLAWSEVLAAYVKAGAGLAAAHRAGLVHQDFKPANVLVGADGRICVGDFGLAQPMEETTNGALLAGTPAYMAPEQLRGSGGSAAADQFSFSVALYEAIYGRRPFSASTARGLALAMEAGPPTVPASPRVPRWLRAAILKGLSFQPASRHPSMAAMISELERARSRRRLARVGVAALLASTITGAALVFGGQAYRTWTERKVCDARADKIKDVWNDGARAKVASIFEKEGKHAAGTVWPRMAKVLDDLSADWVTANARACKEAPQSANGSGDTREVRLLCLDERLRELETLLVMIGEGRPAANAGLDGVASRALKAARELIPGSACLSENALAWTKPQPSPHLRLAVEEVRAKIKRSEGLYKLGRWKDGLNEARQIVPVARGTGYLRVLVEALSWQAAMEGSTGSPVDADALLREAWAVAERTKDERLVASVLTSLIVNSVSSLGRPPGADSIVARASRAVEQAGVPTLQADHLYALSLLREMEGKFDESLELAERVLQLRRAMPENRLLIAEAEGLLSTSAAAAGKWELSVEHAREALAVFRGLLGEDHPLTLNRMSNLSAALCEQGRFDEGRKLSLEAVAIYERLGLEGARHAGLAYLNAAVSANLAGHPSTAERLTRAILEQALRGQRPMKPIEWAALQELGTALAMQGRVKEALETARAAYGFVVAASPDPGRRLEAAVTLADTQLDVDQTPPNSARLRGEIQEALKGRLESSALFGWYRWELGRLAMRDGDARAALEAWRANLQDRHIGQNVLLRTCAAMGALETKLGEPTAIDTLRRAKAIIGTNEIDPLIKGTVDFNLARSLWQRSGQREALTLAEDAERSLVSAGRRGHALLRDLRAWSRGKAIAKASP